MKQIIVAGTVGKDAVMRRTQSGDPILGFSIAVDDGYGQNKTTMWFDASLFGKRGDKVAPYLKKGTKVTVSGDLGKREHEGKTYLTVNVSELTLMGGGERQAAPAQDDGDSYGNRGREMEDTDSIPF